MTVCACAWDGAVKVWHRPKVTPAAGTPNAPWTEIGVMQTAELTQSVTEQNVPNTRTISGGNCLEYVTVDEVGLTLQTTDQCNSNLALALGSVLTGRVGGTAIPNEAHVGYPGGLVPFAHIPNLTLPITVTDVGAATTYDVGTDYDLTEAGILVKTAAEGGTIAIPTDSVTPNIEVNYTDVAQDRIQGLTRLRQELEIFIEGTNKADNGRPLLVHAFRASFSPTETWALLSDGPGPLDLNPALLADATRTGAGVSQFYEVVQQRPA